MAALKWTIILLAFQLMELFDNKSITAAPVHNSDESQNSGMRESIFVDTNDNITDTHKINTLNEGNYDGGAAEKGEDQIISKEGQEVENENEPGVSVTKNLSNPLEDGGITAEASDEGAHVNHEEAAHDHEVTGAAHDEEDTSEAHEDLDTGAGHEGDDDNEDTSVAHEGDVDTGAVHDEEDTSVAHEGDVDTGAVHDEEDTSEAHGDHDAGAVHVGDVDDKEDTSVAH
jgi:hypothetical protein